MQVDTHVDFGMIETIDDTNPCGALRTMLAVGCLTARIATAFECLEQSILQRLLRMSEETIENACDLLMPTFGRTLSLRRPHAIEKVVEPTPKRPLCGQRAMIE